MAGIQHTVGIDDRGDGKIDKVIDTKTGNALVVLNPNKAELRELAKLLMSWVMKDPFGTVGKLFIFVFGGTAILTFFVYLIADGRPQVTGTSWNPANLGANVGYFVKPAVSAVANTSRDTMAETTESAKMHDAYAASIRKKEATLQSKP